MESPIGIGGTYQFNHFIQISEYNMIYQATKLDENKKKIAIELLFIGFGGEITDRTQAPKLKIVWDKWKEFGNIGPKMPMYIINKIKSVHLFIIVAHCCQWDQPWTC